MTSTLTCQVCLLPLNQCRKNDLKLIKPFDKQFESQYTNTRAAKNVRFWRVLYYIAGTYNPFNQQYYFISNKWSEIKYKSTICNMPLCAFEGDYYQLQKNLVDLKYMSLYMLPIESDYRTILKQLAADDVSSYVSSLPPPPKPMPRKRLKTN